MDYYKLLKINNLIINPRIKLSGIYILHQLKRRYLIVFFDPVSLCNLRCKMCYFTDKDYTEKLGRKPFDPADLKLFANAILKRAIKLQVGCGAEPTLYKDLNEIFKLALEYKVPYKSLTTNASLIIKEDLIQWVNSGLDEITVSIHGLFKNTYEEFMGNGNYDRFLESLTFINQVKKEQPGFKFRINYTFNEDNFNELKYFWKVFNDTDIDILQIRPITKLGNTTYNNFSLNKIIPLYNNVLHDLHENCKKRRIRLIAPDKEQLKCRKSVHSVINNYVYCYISPKYFWQDDFNWKNETFDEYARRTKWGRKIFNQIFSSKTEINSLVKDNLNYRII